jgi:hypothetical protein
MKDALKTLLASKRFLIGLTTAVVDVALVFGVDLDPEKLALLLTYINGLAATLIGGISVSDHGKAMGAPAGVDHKGADVLPADD